MEWLQFFNVYKLQLLSIDLIWFIDLLKKRRHSSEWQREKINSYNLRKKSKKDYIPYSLELSIFSKGD